MGIRPKIYLANDGNYREMRWFTPWYIDPSKAGDGTDGRVGERLFSRVQHSVDLYVPGTRITYIIVVCLLKSNSFNGCVLVYNKTCLHASIRIPNKTGNLTDLVFPEC